MNISVSSAKGHLTELVRRVEEGEEVILTRHGHAVARLEPVKRPSVAATRREVMEEVRRMGRATGLAGPSAARSQDFLYGDDGLPQ